MISRNKSTFFIFVLLLIFQIFFLNGKIESTIKNYDTNQFLDFLSALVSYSSLTTAFLFFISTLIPLFNDKNDLYKIFKTDIKLLESIMLVTLLFMMSSIFSLLIFFFTVMKIDINIWFIHIWLNMNVTATISLIVVIINFLKDINNELSK